MVYKLLIVIVIVIDVKKDKTRMKNRTVEVGRVRGGREKGEKTYKK